MLILNSVTFGIAHLFCSLLDYPRTETGMSDRRGESFAPTLVAILLAVE